MPEHRCSPYDVDFTPTHLPRTARARCCGRTWNLVGTGRFTEWVDEERTKRASDRVRGNPRRKR